MEFKKVKIKDIADTNTESIGKKVQFDYINYLDTSNITKGIIDNIVKLNVSEAPSRARRIVHKNDIIYSTVRPNLCHYGIIDNPVDNMIVSTGFTVITCSEDVNPYYVYYYLIQDEITMTLHSIAENSTSAYPSIKPSDLENLEIRIPSLENQNKIVKILNDLNNKIKLNNGIVNNLLSINKYLYLEKIKKIEEDYNEESYKSLDSVVNLNSRGISPNYVDNGIPVINQSCIRNNIIQEEKIQFHNELKTVRNEFYYKPYDILINSMGVGTLGRVSQIGDLKKDYLVHNCITILRSNEEYITQYILGQVMMNKQEEIENMAQGSTGQTSLNNKDLGKMRIFIPPEEIQIEVSNILKDNLDIITNRLLENDRLIELRDLLLPKLINGVLDLDNVEV